MPIGNGKNKIMWKDFKGIQNYEKKITKVFLKKFQKVASESERQHLEDKTANQINLGFSRTEGLLSI